MKECLLTRTRLSSIMKKGYLKRIKGDENVVLKTFIEQYKKVITDH